ncbi:MAG TPA: GAF domain-containing protein [Bryobacteraceae bacterium]
MNTSPELDQWLRNFLTEQEGAAGTVHLFEKGGLRLVSAINIPPQVQQVVAWVPNGKGMAGLALKRKEPIQTCNLKDDSSGNVRPGAKAVNARAAVALPISDGAAGVRAVVGIAFPHEREFTKTELDELTAAASTVPNT